MHKHRKEIQMLKHIFRAIFYALKCLKFVHRPAITDNRILPAFKMQLHRSPINVQWLVGVRRYMRHPERAGTYYLAEDYIGHCNMDFCHPPAINWLLCLRMLVPCTKICINSPLQYLWSNPCFSHFLSLKIAWFYLEESTVP